MSKQKASIRSRASSSSSASPNPRKHIGRCCRKFVAFMCTQVGVGGLIVGYAIVGAFSFTAIEKQYEDNSLSIVKNLRLNYSRELWMKIETFNLFNKSIWQNNSDDIIKRYQANLTYLIKQGYDGRTPEDIWSFSHALTFCLSIFTMIGYGNMVPRTPWGKGLTVIYATFGIPLYILYFLNMGKVLAKSFRFLYRVVHDCTHESSRIIGRKKVIVPSTACLWVIIFYIFTGTVMFANWEKWSYLESVYFCMTSLCKIGFGDFVPGANIKLSTEIGASDQENTTLLKDQIDQQTKLAINFVYMLIGMSLVAMCYNLMREKIRVRMKELKEDMKLCLEDVKERFDVCCGRDYYDEEYYY